MDSFDELILNIYRSGPVLNRTKRRSVVAEKILYSILIQKYPDYYWVEKYVLADKVSLVPEICCLYICYERLLTDKIAFDALWTYTANANLCTSLIELTQTPVITIIRLNNGTKHLVMIVGYEEENHLFFIHDPLGDYHTNYHDSYGANIPF